jgi:hypothetical protein
MKFKQWLYKTNPEGITNRDVIEYVLFLAFCVFILFLIKGVV